MYDFGVIYLHLFFKECMLFSYFFNEIHSIGPIVKIHICLLLFLCQDVNCFQFVYCVHEHIYRQNVFGIIDRNVLALNIVKPAMYLNIIK